MIKEISVYESENLIVIINDVDSAITIENVTITKRGFINSYGKDVHYVKFDAKVKNGILPKGYKTPGKGPVWFKKDLDEYLKKYDNKKKTLSTDI